jgi:hypothetical protein
MVETAACKTGEEKRPESQRDVQSREPMETERYSWKRRSAVVALFLFGIVAGGSGMVRGETVTAPELAALLPSDLLGWTPEGQDEVYDPDSLFDYIDGGAELYRSFNVRKVLARRYVKAGAPEIIVDVFDMGSSADAFGVYHHELREGGEAGVGLESEYQGGSLQFWKGRFLVSITAMEESDESKRAALELGRAIAAALSEPGEPPALLSLLPEKGRLASTVRYFHNQHCLNTYYFLADQNILNLSSKTEGVLARYPTGDPGQQDAKSYVVLVVRYPSQAEAKAAHDKFLGVYLPDADSGGAARTENLRWVLARLKGDLFMGVFDAPSRETAERVIQGLKSAP